MRSLVVFLIVLTAAIASAEAHPLVQEPMWILSEPGHVRVAVNVSAREIEVAQALQAREDGGIADAARLAQAAQREAAYVRGHLRVLADGRELAGQITKISPPQTIASDEKTVYQYELDYPISAPEPSKIMVSQDMLREFPYAVGMAWDVSYVVRLKRAGSDEIETALLRAEQPFEFSTRLIAAAPSKPTPRPQGEGRIVALTVAAAAPAPPPQGEGWRTFCEYFRHGVMHILTGYDHLLFVSALVLAAVSFWDMVKVIAAFTLAHTITLALSVFDIFRLPPWVVEPVIALSIVFVALENVLWPRRSRSWVRLGVAFSFGLVHGLGFAGGLLDAMAGLPSVGIWIALGAFSLGVEIGHQLVVLPLFGLLALGRRVLHEGFAKPAMRYGSLVISLCGAYYLCVAIHEQFFSR
jgi:hydrogenase/urease accessory protein HupE